ncbi:MAG: hypothetical protein WCJ76_08760 [Comamonadaceae bacterium]
MLFSSLYRPGGDDHLCVSRQCGSFEYLVDYARRLLEQDANGSVEIRDAYGILHADLATNAGELVEWHRNPRETQ